VSAILGLPDHVFPLAAQPKGAVWSVEKATMVAQPERVQLARFLRQHGFRLD
jgi:hypothetical protein